MDRLFELLLLDALVKGAREEEEDRPDNFFVLPANDNEVWQNVFKKCIEENMVVGVEFTTADQSQKPIRAAIIRLARQFNRQAIFLRAPIGPLSTHDQRAIGGVQYTPSFLIVSFLEDRGEVRRFEGTLEVRTVLETGKIRKDFEECLERRARLRVAENLAERLASGLAAAMEGRRKQEEERAKETPEQRRAREAQQEREKRREEEERKKQEEEERRKRRPEHVAQLLAMDLNKAPPKHIIDLMRKLGVNPTGLPERGDLIAELKKKVPELRMKLDNPSAPVGIMQPPPSPSASINEDLSNMDHDLLQGVARRIRNIDLQRAELHELKSLLSQAQLCVRNYPDRNSMVQALKRVMDAAERTRSHSSYFGTVYRSNLTNDLSANDTSIDNFEQRNAKERDQDARVAELERQLAEKDQKIESLTGEVKKLEITSKISARGSRQVFPPGP